MSSVTQCVHRWILPWSASDLFYALYIMRREGEGGEGGACHHWTDNCSCNLPCQSSGKPTITDNQTVFFIRSFMSSNFNHNFHNFLFILFLNSCRGLKPTIVTVGIFGLFNFFFFMLNVKVVKHLVFKLKENISWARNCIPEIWKNMFISEYLKYLNLSNLHSHMFVIFWRIFYEHSWLNARFEIWGSRIRALITPNHKLFIS